MIVLARLIVAAAVGLHILIKMIWPGYLASAPFDGVLLAWLDWWTIVFLILSTIAAYILMPSFAALLTWLAARGIAPFFIFILFLVGIAWACDLTWNATVLRVCDTCPESRILPSFSAALTGGQ